MLGEKGENPRASTTDDVECFFSIMRDLAGKHFTLRHKVTQSLVNYCTDY